MGLIRTILNIYMMVLICDAVLSYLPQYRHHTFAKKINTWANFSLAHVRKLLPGDFPVDISHIIVIVTIQVFIALF